MDLSLVRAPPPGRNQPAVGEGVAVAPWLMQKLRSGIARDRYPDRRKSDRPGMGFLRRSTPPDLDPDDPRGRGTIVATDLPAAYEAAETKGHRVAHALWFCRC